MGISKQFRVPLWNVYFKFLNHLVKKHRQLIDLAMGNIFRDYFAFGGLVLKTSYYEVAVQRVQWNNQKQ